MDTLTFAGFKCQALYSKGKGGTPIVFLHGLSYDMRKQPRKAPYHSHQVMA